MSKKLTAKKAAKILKDGTAHGRKLTKKQKKFFGVIASGEVPRKSKSRKRK